MSLFTREALATLMSAHEPPCVTICLPTHRRLPESQQNTVRYANLVKEAAATVEKGFGKRGPGAAVVGKLESLIPAGGNAPEPWSHPQDGFAVFASPDSFQWFRVPTSLREITVVADSFHVKPLLPLLFDDVRYHVLAVTQNEVQVYSGNGDHLHEIRVPTVPRSLTEALGSEWDDSHQGTSFHGTRGRAAGSSGPTFHGYSGAGKTGEGDKVELQRFLRAVDRAVDAGLSRPTGLPLILAAVDYYHPIFRDVSRNQHLVAEGITQDPKGLTRDQLHQAAWNIFTPIRTARLDKALEEFGTGQAHAQGSGDLKEIARAAVSGRVRRLILEDARRVWGRIDRATGELATGGSPGNAGDADVLDDLAEIVLSAGGEVLLAPAAKMPSATGAAALYRY